MKIIRIFLLSLICASSACSDDDSSGNNDNNNQQDSITLGGTTYIIADGKSVNNHYAMNEFFSQQSFVLSDSEITVNIPSSGAASCQIDTDFMMHLRAYTEDMSFSPGTFTFGCCDERYFTLSVFIGTNVYTSEQGTVTISGSAPNYVLEFEDMLLRNNDQEILQMPDFRYDDGFEFTDNP